MSAEAPPPFLYRAPGKVHYMDTEYQKKFVRPESRAWGGTEAEGPAAGQVVKTFLSERLSAHAIPRIFKSPSTVSSQCRIGRSGRMRGRSELVRTQ